MDQNYFAHGGRELVIGGKLTFLPGATVEGLSGLTDVMPEQATEYLPPGIPDSKASRVTDLREDFNRLLHALRAAGILAQEDAHDPDAG